MFFSEHRLKMTSLRIGKHRTVKNIASLRKVNIAHPYVHSSLWTMSLLITIEQVTSNEEPLVVVTLAYNAFVFSPIPFHHPCFAECVGHRYDPHCGNSNVSFFPHWSRDAKSPTWRGEEDFGLGHSFR